MNEYMEGACAPHCLGIMGNSNARHEHDFKFSSSHVKNGKRKK